MCCRYLILLMSLHSIYAGFMYNDVFSMGLNLFGSRWVSSSPGGLGPKVPDPEGPYPFGVDPAWKGASNELLFLNSLKMKLAILVRLPGAAAFAAATVIAIPAAVAAVIGVPAAVAAIPAAVAIAAVVLAAAVVAVAAAGAFLRWLICMWIVCCFDVCIGGLRAHVLRAGAVGVECHSLS